DAERTLRRPRHDAAGSHETPWDSRSGQPPHHAPAWPREAALHQSRSDPSDRRTLDQEIRARETCRAQRVETATQQEQRVIEAEQEPVPEDDGAVALVRPTVPPLP